MEQISAIAIRNGKSIEVLIKGFLPNSCHIASIVDFYPGGNIIYIEDPGVSQVFIQEIANPGATFCIEVLIPWAGTIVIPNTNHTEVEIYINKLEKLQIAVGNHEALYVVCRFDGYVVDYNIVPDGRCSNQHPWHQVFGPDTYLKCLEFKNTTIREMFSKTH